MSRNRTRKMSQKQNGKHSPIIAVIAGIVLILLASLALYRPVTNAIRGPASTGAPSLKVDKEKVDLGDVKLGESVSVSFKLTNTGEETLRFNEDPYVEILDGC